MHQLKHGTIRSIASPALPENKAQFLQLSSAFPRSPFQKVFDRRCLADLHLVSTITVELLITTLPPPSSPQAGIFASITGLAVQEFPSSDHSLLQSPLAIYFTPRELVAIMQRRRTACPPYAFWLRRITPFFACHGLRCPLVDSSACLRETCDVSMGLKAKAIPSFG